MKPNKCNDICVMYRALRGCIKNSGIPKDYIYPAKLKAIKADLLAFQKLNNIKRDIQEFVKQGDNLLIYSAGCGNGKTTWACKILINYFCTIEDGNFIDTRGLFINVIEFLINNRLSREQSDYEFINLLNKIKKVDLIVWDELGIKKLTDYEQMFLYNFINFRISNNLSNIFTSNCTLEEAKNIWMPQLYSRIYSNSKKIELLCGDCRNPKFVKNAEGDK